MENASQALSIAGAVLIGVLLLALLVTFFNNLSSYEQTKQDNLLQAQTTNFNKQFYNYQKNLYGSEVLSLSNKIANYNIKESDSKGYSKIDIEIIFNNEYKIDSNNIIKKNIKYNSEQINNFMANLENKISALGNRKPKKNSDEYIINQLYTMRDNEIEVWCSKKGYNKNEIKDLISEYTNLKSIELTIKNRIFKYIETKFEDNTGRITLIKYIEQ